MQIETLTLILTLQFKKKTNIYNTKILNQHRREIFNVVILNATRSGIVVRFLGSLYEIVGLYLIAINVNIYILGTDS